MSVLNLKALTYTKSDKNNFTSIIYFLVAIWGRARIHPPLPSPHFFRREGKMAFRFLPGESETWFLKKIDILNPIDFIIFEEWIILLFFLVQKKISFLDTKKKQVFFLKELLLVFDKSEVKFFPINKTIFLRRK